MGRMRLFASQTMEISSDTPGACRIIHNPVAVVVDEVGCRLPLSVSDRMNENYDRQKATCLPHAWISVTGGFRSLERVKPVCRNILGKGSNILLRWARWPWPRCHLRAPPPQYCVMLAFIYPLGTSRMNLMSVPWKPTVNYCTAAMDPLGMSSEFNTVTHVASNGWTSSNQAEDHGAS